MSDRHVVLGAGGNVGTAVVHEPVNRGKSIGVPYQQWTRTYPAATIPFLTFFCSGLFWMAGE
jgi:hypothetical protein